MKKLRLPLVAIILLASVMLLSSCSALDGVFLLGEDIFDSVIGAIDKSPLGAIYDALNIEGLITGENGGNFENPDEEKEEAVKVESLAIDTTAVKTVYKFGEEFTAEGLKIVATFTDGTTKELSLSDVSIKTPDTTAAGVRVVSISYGGKSARYEITINPRVYPTISDTSLVDILAKNESTPYRVEAEAIDMTQATGNAVNSTTDEIVSGNKYLTNLGGKYNYFGFSFTAAEAYEGVTVVIRVANHGDTNLQGEAVKTYLNFSMDENGAISGELPLDGLMVEADGQWIDIIIRNLNLKEGVNTITFDVQGKDAFDIDYVDLYVGSRYINSVVEISSTDRVIRDIETLDTEKAFTRTDVADAHGLKDGQLFVEPVKKEWPGCSTSGGTSVGAIGKGSLISTTLRLSEDATIRIWFKASKTTPTNSLYYVDDNWNFYIDGVKLQFVDYIDIHGGDKSQEMYWEWKLTSLGEINLPAGDHTFVIEVVGVDCNVDTVEFEILSLGSYDEIGKGLDEQKHVCADTCAICGKCTTDCTESACADKCPGCRPEYDAIISDGRVVIEAESLPIDKLVPETSAGVKIESFTGGQGIAAIKSGGYQTFTILPDKDMTVNFIVNFAKKAGGSILTYIPTVSVNGKNITLNNATVPAGTSSNQYWNLSEILLATIELKANVKYEFKVSLNSGNLDKYIFDVVEGGGQQIPEDKFDLTLATNGVTKYELENIDCSQCDIVTRNDFIPSVGEGNCGKGSGRIYGFDNGSVFRVYVKVTEACTVKISIAGYADASRANGNEKLSTYTWKLGDQVITPDADAAINLGSPVSEAVVGTVEITEAGIYVFEFSFGVYTDLDYLSFEIVK